MLKGFDNMTYQPAWIKYSNIIEKLRHEASSPDLHKKIKDCLGSKFSNSLVFQLKMEIKRQNRTSKKPLRISDVIKNVDSYLVNIGGVDHYLEEFSEKYLMQLYKKHGGRYTVGIQECVDKFIKNKKDVIEKNQNLKRLNCFPIDVSESIRRKEERIHFGVKAEAFVVKEFFNEKTRPIIDFCSNETIPCVTQNISVNGLRIRTKIKGEEGSLFLVRLTGLEKEIKLQHPYICYRLIRCEHDLKRECYIWFFEKQENRYHADFDRYLSKLINESQVKNRADTTVLERFVLNNLAEQYFTNRQEELVLFTNKYSLASYAYGSNISKVIFNFFNTSKGNAINTLIEKDNLPEVSRDQPRYWIVKKDENKGFYSTVLCAKLMDNLFFKIMMEENNVMFFKVEMLNLDHKNHLKQEVDDGELHDRTKKELDYLTGMLILKPLSISLLRSLVPRALCEKLTEKDNIPYRPSEQDKSPNKIEFIQSEVWDLRQEQRYMLEGPVVLKNDYGEFDGTISNISPKGLSVILKNDAESITTSSVYVSFPKIKSKVFNETYFKYKVMGQKSGVLRLFASPECKPNASKFLGNFLKLNSDELKLSPERSDLKGFERALRRLYSASMPTVKGLVSVQSKNAHVTHMNISKTAKSHPIFEKINTMYQDCKNIKNLILQPDFTHLLFSRLKKTSTGSLSNALMCIGFRQDGEKLQIVATKTWVENNVDYHKAKKLNDALKEKGVLTAWFQVSVAKKSRISSVIHLGEYRKLEALSPHKVDEIDKLVRNTIGVFDMTPIDDWLDMWN